MCFDCVDFVVWDWSWIAGFQLLVNSLFPRRTSDLVKRSWYVGGFGVHILLDDYSLLLIKSIYFFLLVLGYIQNAI